MCFTACVPRPWHGGKTVDSQHLSRWSSTGSGEPGPADPCAVEKWPSTPPRVHPDSTAGARWFDGARMGFGAVLHSPSTGRSGGFRGTQAPVLGLHVGTVVALKAPWRPRSGFRRPNPPGARGTRGPGAGAARRRSFHARGPRHSVVPLAYFPACQVPAQRSEFRAPGRPFAARPAARVLGRPEGPSAGPSGAVAGAPNGSYPVPPPRPRSGRAGARGGRRALLVIRPRTWLPRRPCGSRTARWSGPVPRRTRRSPRGTGG